MYELNVTGHFDAAHFLRGYEGPCSSVHGHTWNYYVKIEGPKLNKLGMLVDFKDIKQVMEQFDHKLINECPPFGNDVFSSIINPTAENLVEFFFRQMERIINVREVTIYESDSCSATYKPD